MSVITEREGEIGDDSDIVQGAGEDKRRKSSSRETSTEHGKSEVTVGHPAVRQQ